MAISKDYYKKLSVEELVLDDYFIQSIISPTPESGIFWKSFREENPGKSEDLDEARKVISSLNFKQRKVPPGLKERLWNEIQSSAVQERPVVKMRSYKKWIWGAAAACVFLAVIAAYLFMDETREKVNTQFTEVRQVILPDQSVVTLNANSTIRYSKNWKQGKPREVWLNGEAYFDVKHLNKEGTPVKEYDRFIVHAGETDVEVLGTTFNVSERQAVTKVMLESGKVRIDFTDKKTASVVMQPGEVVKYDPQSKRLVKEVAEVEKYTSWKRKEFLLDNTSVEEIIGVIENTLGYKVVIEGKDMLNRQLSGTGKVSLENEETLFRSLELLLEVEITKKDDTLFIKKN